MAKDLQPHTNKHIPFEVYRYQVVVNKTIQLSLGTGFQSPGLRYFKPLTKHGHKLIRQTKIKPVQNICTGFKTLMNTVIFWKFSSLPRYYLLPVGPDSP